MPVAVFSPYCGIFVLMYFTEHLRIILFEVIIMPKTGEKPGAGQYTCKECGKTLTLDDETDKLPPCSNCGGTEFR